MTGPTLPAAIAALIHDEQQRHDGRFIEGVDLESYLQKLATRAEFVSESAEGRCRGFVAFYCNDLQSGRAFISLVLVAPEARSSGLGRTLVSRVLEVCRKRGFTSCGLEVRADNAAALALYESLGFDVVNECDERKVLEKTL